VTFASPILAILTGLCAIGAVIVVRRRKIPLTLQAKILSVTGLLLLTLAAGSPSILRRAPTRVVIMADFSESTRGASYRDGKLIRKLAAENHASVVQFPTTSPSDETTFDPPDADAIILLSDGQFDLPVHAPPTYPIIDPNLAAAKDASIANLQYRNREIVATVVNSGDDATLKFSSNPNRPKAAPHGTNTVSDSIPRNLDPITAQLNAHDLWPENNALTIAPSPPLNVEKWWVGPSPPDATWRQKRLSDLPTQASLYLLPSVIVLDGIIISQLSPAQVTRLEQYATDLGGSIILLDLPRQPAFSPLSDSPPLPQRRWVILCDVSGSMAQRAGDAPRIDKAIAAVRLLIPTLPVNDRVDVGGFSRDLTWWTSGRRAMEVARSDSIPSTVSPSGPTNLESLLHKLLESPGDNLPSEVLLITDAEADVRDVDSLVAALRASNVRLNLLQVGKAVSAPIERLVKETSGRTIDASESVDWTGALQSLAAGGLTKRVVIASIQIAYHANNYRLPSIRETWLKDGAVSLAQAIVEARTLPAVAQRSHGSGKVVAITAPQRELALRIADEIASPPRDPRVTVTIQTGEKTVVQVDAKGQQGYLNGLSLFAQLGDGDRVKIPQTQPGRYEVTLNPQAVPSILTIYREGAIADRIAIAGRYPREFARIGINRENLEDLANLTGGKMIENLDGASVSIHRRVPREIAPPLLIAASVCFAVLLMLWKWGRFLA